MLTEFRIVNFKALREAVVRPSLITVFIGANGTGKSSVLQALLMLRQSWNQAGLQTSGELVDLGAFENVQHHVKTSLDEMTFGLSWQFKGLGRALTDEGVSFQYEMNFAGNTLASHSVRVAVDGHDPFLTATMTRGANPSLNVAPEAGSAQFQSHGVAIFGFPQIEINNSKLMDVWREAIAAVQGFLMNLRVVQSSRGFLEPQYPLLDGPSDEPGSPAETASTLAYERGLERPLSVWLRKLLGTKATVRTDLTPGKKVAVGVEYAERLSNLVNEGFGINQLLERPLVELLMAKRGALVAIEEPEIHLHPKAQAVLALILAEAAKKDSKQVVITTHSEHILIALLTLVAQGRLAPSELAIHYFERKPRNTARVTRLPVDDRGRVRGGLRGFFEAGISEFRRYQEAIEQLERGK